MSERYDDYIESHKQNVISAFEWLMENVPTVLDNDLDLNLDDLRNKIMIHDATKYSREEYAAYDRYFYGGNKSYEVKMDFNRAWLSHIHNNPHHWQHWILINDNPNEGEIILDMPDVYIIEMICDWLSFSIAKGDLFEIFNWYKEHKDHMKLSDYTRKKVEDILSKIRSKLNFEIFYNNNNPVESDVNEEN